MLSASLKSSECAGTQLTCTNEAMLFLEGTARSLALWSRPACYALWRIGQRRHPSHVRCRWKKGPLESMTLMMPPRRSRRDEKRRWSRPASFPHQRKNTNYKTQHITYTSHCIHVNHSLVTCHFCYQSSVPLLAQFTKFLTFYAFTVQ